MDLKQALRLERCPSGGEVKPARLAFVGAGGKTTALFILARELTPPVLVTTTTHFAVWQTSLADRHIRSEEMMNLENVVNGSTDKVILLTGGPTEEERLCGLNVEALHQVQEIADDHGWHLLVEADGSRQKPMKAPAEHEPAIPPFVDTVVVVMGLSALGKPLDADSVHRAEIFSKLGDIRIGDTISKEAIVKVLNHPQGGLKNIPVNARRVLLFNQVDSDARRKSASQMAAELLPSYHSVILANLSPVSMSGRSDRTIERDMQSILAAYEPVAGIVLAAGESRRFGQPKQLLTWQGMPLVRKVTLTAIEAGLHPIVVVTGSAGDLVQQAVKELPIVTIHNPDWMAGQSTSIRAGLSALPAHIGGAMFLLADQPFVSVSLLRALVECHAETFSPIVAPKVEGKRANPMLFDRDLFPYLLDLQGDVGGRLLLSRFTPSFVPWSDSKVLLDIDTPEDYQTLLDNVLL